MGLVEKVMKKLAKAQIVYGRHKQKYDPNQKYKAKPTLHKIIREYEQYRLTASEMIGRIMLLEGVSDEDL